MFKYLVKELIIKQGRETKTLSLNYIDIIENKIHIRPFDKERAGYEYIEMLTLTFSDKDNRELIFEHR